MICDLSLKHVPELVPLLASVQAIHAAARPDRFHMNASDADYAAFLETKFDDGAQIIGYRSGGVLVGYAMVLIEDKPETAFTYAMRGAYLEHVSVAEQARGQGIGRALIAAMEDRLEALGIHQWRVSYWSFNAASQGLMASVGATCDVTVRGKKLVAAG